MNSIDIGVAVVGIPMPLLFVVSIALFLLTALAWIAFYLWWKRERKRATSTRAILLESAPKLVQEIFVDRDSFTLLGADWCRMEDIPIDYGCPICERRIRTNLQQHYHSSGDTYSIMRHTCAPSLDTLPLQAIKKEPRP